MERGEKDRQHVMVPEISQVALLLYTQTQKSLRNLIDIEWAFNVFDYHLILLPERCHFGGGVQNMAF